VRAPWCRSGTSSRKSKHPAEEDEGRRVAHRARKKSYVPSPPRLHIGGNTSERSPQLKLVHVAKDVHGAMDAHAGGGANVSPLDGKRVLVPFMSRHTRIVPLRVARSARAQVESKRGFPR